MKISHNWLQTYFKDKIPSAGELEALFAAHSFEIESVEEIHRSDLGSKDTVFEIKVLPDMAHYCLSHEGIAGEISFITGLIASGRQAPPVETTLKVEPKVKIVDKKFCRRYMARIAEVKPLQNTASPKWLTELLGAIGQRSISPIVDITNYVMYDIGQPLHAFDADKIKGSLVVRPAKDGEKIVLLDGRELTLTESDNVIADDEGPLVVAGAKGGKRAEIGPDTKTIIIEAANFSPTAVRRTSNRYDIRSDSSKRFENEITPELASQGMANVSDLIKQICPEARFGPIVDLYEEKAKQTVIEFDPDYLEERLGTKIPLTEAKKILERMNVFVNISSNNAVDSRLRGNDTTKHAGDNNDTIKHAGNNKENVSNLATWSLTIPFKRLDLVIKEDIVEEIGRIYGYSHVKGLLPPLPEKKLGPNPNFYLSEKIKNILVQAGFYEVSLYSLVEKGEVETAKPLAKDKAFARAELTPGLKACLERNSVNADLLGLDTIKIFEIGRVFCGGKEKIHLSIGIRQVKKVKGLKPDKVLGDTLALLEVPPLEVEPPKITTDGNSVYYEINLTPVIAKLGGELVVSDLNFEKASPNRYTRFSLFPFIVRDIAFFVPEALSEDKVWRIIEKGIAESQASELLVKHSLFDVFKKDGRTSYAFRLIFQSMERTLTDDEIAEVMDKITDLLKKEGWEVR